MSPYQTTCSTFLPAFEFSLSLRFPSFIPPVCLSNKTGLFSICQSFPAPPFNACKIQNQDQIVILAHESPKYYNKSNINFINILCLLLNLFRFFFFFFFWHFHHLFDNTSAWRSIGCTAAGKRAACTHVVGGVVVVKVILAHR